MVPLTEPLPKKRRYDDHGSAASAAQDDSFGVQSLPVGILPEGFSGDPTDGEQYLAIVRREAAAAPGIFLAAHNPHAASPSVPHNGNGDASSSSASSTLVASASTTEQGAEEDRLLMPSPEWKQAFSTQFQNAREALSNPPTQPVKLTKDDLPKIGNTNAWYAWMHGRPPPPASPEEAERQSSKAYEWRLREPSATLLLRLSTEQILGLLEAFPYWLAHRVPIPDSQGQVVEAEVLQPFHARWLFSLLLKLDARLVSEEISILRTLARACVAAITLSRIRRKALRSRHKPGGEVGEAQESGEARMSRDEAGAWMVVAIVAGVWGQSDLWEDAIADMRRVT